MFVGVAVTVQFPEEVPQLPVLVAYAGGPITMAEPLLVGLLVVAGPEEEEDEPDEVEAEEEPQALFARTEN